MNERYWKILKNRYFIAGFLILTWMTFFDQNNFIHRIQKSMQLHDLKEEKAYYKQKIKETKKARDHLMKNNRTLERFAREQYFMKKPNEDLYVIVEDEE